MVQAQVLAPKAVMPQVVQVALEFPYKDYTTSPPFLFSGLGAGLEAVVAGLQNVTAVSKAVVIFASPKTMKDGLSR
jgi:hypothetical protein